MLKGYNESLNATNKVEDSGLASPNNSAYRTLLGSATGFKEAIAAGTYIPQNSFTPQVSGANIAATSPPPSFYFAKADYEVAGKTQKLRLRAQVAANATKPLIKFTVGLYPITVAGAANQVAWTLGTVVSGSTVEFNEPAASTATSKETADFTIPSDGFFCLGIVTSAGLTANAAVTVHGQLQTRSV